MKTTATFLVILFSYVISFSQATWSSEKMLAKTAQVWGYLKYFHSNVNECTINWDSVLIAHIPEIKNAENDADFNAGLLAIINAAGAMEIPVSPSSEPSAAYLH